MIRWFIRCASFVGLGLLIAGCSRTDTEGFDTTLGDESYALIKVDNESGQRNDITVNVTDAAPGTSYALLFTPDEPANAGWFELPSDYDASCTQIDCPTDEGSVVDFGTVAPGQTTLALSGSESDSGSGDSVHHDHDRWSGYWAVMRVDRGGTSHVHVQVEATAPAGDYATAPDITRLM